MAGSLLPHHPRIRAIFHTDQPGHARAEADLGRILNLLERYRYWVLGAVFVWMLLGFNGMWRIGPDTAFFATVARNVNQGKGFVHPTGDASRVRPGLVWMFMANFQWFGPQTLWPIILGMWAMGLAVLGLTYRLIAIHMDRGQAVAATVLLAVCNTFYMQSLDVLADLPFLFGLMVFLLGYEQRERRIGPRWANWALIAGGIVCMTAFKITIIVVVGAWFAAEAWKIIREPRRGLEMLGPLGAIAFVWLTRVLDPRGQTGQGPTMKEQEIANHLGGTPGQTLFSIVPANFVDLITHTLPEAVFGNQFGLTVLTVIVSLSVLVAGLMLFRHRVLWGLLILGFVVQWLAFLPDGRYVLVIMPLLAFAWWRHAVRISQSWPARFRWPMFVCVVGLWLAMNGGRTIGNIITQRRGEFYRHYESGYFQGLNQVGHWLDSHTPPQSRIFTRDKWTGPLIFFSHRPVYNQYQPPPTTSNQPATYLVCPTNQQLTGKLTGKAPNAHWHPGPRLFEQPKSANSKPLIVYRLKRE